MEGNGIHDCAGRFRLGNPGGPGRPPRSIEGEYLTALAEAVGMEDWHAIVARAVKDAKAGEAKARDWLGKYLVPDWARIDLMLNARESEKTSQAANSEFWSRLGEILSDVPEKRGEVGELLRQHVEAINGPFIPYNEAQHRA
jgi:hypothetical protein